MPNKSTEQLIEEALEEFDKLAPPIDWRGYPSRSIIRNFIETKLTIIATKSAEREQEENKLIIDVTKDAIANGDERFAKEQGFPLFEGEWSSAINLLTYLQEALSKPKE